jgi:hypothetical protein
MTTSARRDPSVREPRFARSRRRRRAPYSAFAERLFRETYVDGYDPADIDDYVAQAFSPRSRHAS